MKMKLFLSSLVFTIASGMAVSQAATAASPKMKAPGPAFYREFTMRIQNKGTFRVFMPDGRHSDINYEFEFGEPVYPEVMMGDYLVETGKSYFYRNFYDRILVKDGSFIEIGGEKLPLTCVVVAAQDNRFSGPKSPVIPDYIFKIHLVANDFACQGPVRPGWPNSGGRKENWDTFLHFEVKDPTIMLPTDTEVRYRWNEYNAIWIDAGKK